MISLWSLKLSKDQIRGIFHPNWKKGVQLKSASLVFSCISAKINATRFNLRISIFLCTFTKFFNPFYNLANFTPPPQISKSQYIYFPHWFRQNKVIKLKNMELPLSYRWQIQETRPPKPTQHIYPQLFPCISNPFLSMFRFLTIVNRSYLTASYRSNVTGQILLNIKTINIYGKQNTNARNKLFNTFSLKKHPRKYSHIKRKKSSQLSLLNIIIFQNHVLSSMLISTFALYPTKATSCI